MMSPAGSTSPLVPEVATIARPGQNMHTREPGRLLAQLADLLGRAAAEEAVDAAVGIAIGTDGVDLHLRPIGCHVPAAEQLCGFDAPAHWDVVGIVARGLARPLAAGAMPRGEVVVVHLQARSGASCSMIGAAPGPLQPAGAACGGRLVDVCRRTLGLPTDPPDTPPLQWWAARWLDLLVGVAGLELHRSGHELVGHFPGPPPAAPADLDDLEAHGLRLGRTTAWSSLRAAAAAGTLAVPGITPGHAAWMDDGMFARWALDALPSCHTSLAELEPRLPPTLAHRLRRLLQVWSTPPAGHGPAHW